MRWDKPIPPRKCSRALPIWWKSKKQRCRLNNERANFRLGPLIQDNPASAYFNLTTLLLQEDFYYEHSKLSKIQASKTKVGKTQVSARFPTRLVGSSFPAQRSAGAALGK